MFNQNKSIMNKKVLVAAAENLNEILGLDPAIDVKASDKKLEAKVKEGILWLQVSDDPSEETIEAIKAIDWADDDFEDLDADQDPIPVLQKYGVWLNEQSLEEEVTEATTLKELKDLAKANDEFKELRSGLTKFKTGKDLKAAMLELLSDEEEPEEEDTDQAEYEAAVEAEMEEEQEEEEKPKTTKPAKKAPPAKKPAPKKKSDKPKESSIFKTYARIDSVAQALTGDYDVETIDDLVEVSNNIYVENGGKDNIKEARTMTNYALKTLAHFDVDIPRS